MICVRFGRNEFRRNNQLVFQDGKVFTLVTVFKSSFKYTKTFKLGRFDDQSLDLLTPLNIPQVELSLDGHQWTVLCTLFDRSSEELYFVK